MYENLVRRLRQLAEEQMFDFERQPYLQAADAIEELSKPRWMRVTYFDGGNWCWPTREAMATTRIAPITHWMPLPEPPKEEN